MYDQVRKALADHEFYEFGGVPANPEYEVLIAALDSHHPAARVYLDFPDFSFWLLEPRKIHAVAGFGRIETMEPEEVFLAPETGAETLMAGAAQHVNEDHGDVVQLYAQRLCGQEPGGWRVSAIDADGFLIEKDDRVHRIVFDAPALSSAALRQAFVMLAAKVREIDGIQS